MPISAGDAIFNFLGDATQLDQTWTKVEGDANAKAPIVQQQVNGIGQAWEQAGQDAATAAQQTTQAGEQMGAAAQGAAAASSQAAATASPGWLALARATDAATRATIEHDVAQKELEAAISAAARAQQGDEAALTALAAAEQKVATTAALLASAQKDVEIASTQATAAMRTEAEAALQSEVALKAAASAGLTFGQDVKLGAEEASFSMQEAKGTIALAGEEIGVTVPRHVRGFLAELPGVGAALEAAFSGFAVLILIQLLVEATEKLTEFVSETFIYTEAMKKEYEEQVKLNDELLKHNERIQQLKESYQLLGLEGTAKISKEFEILTGKVRDTEAAIRDADNVVARDRLGLGDANGTAYTDAQVAEANRRRVELRKVLEEQQNEQAALSRNFDLEALQETIRHTEASINAEKTAGAARIELARAESELRLTLAKAGYSSFIEAQQGFAEQQYQNTLTALQRTASALAQDPTRNADRIKELNAQIEALEDTHQAKLLEIRLKGVKALQVAIAAAANQTQSSPLDALVPLPSEVNERVQEVTDILAQFGIKSGQTWQAEADNAQAAFDRIKATGVATYAQLLQLKEKIAEAKLGGAVDAGDFADAIKYRSALEGIRNELRLLGIETDKDTVKNDKLNRSHQGTIHLLDTWSEHMRKQRKDLTDTQKAFDDVIMDTSAAFGNAISQWVLGQESLGRALRQSLAEEAATIAGRAAMWGLYWTAWGIADSFWNPARAGADFASAAEFFAVAAVAGGFAYAIKPGESGGGETPGAPAGTQPIETSGATQTESQPVQSTNVQRFAAGAFVQNPTMAIIGDAMNGASSSQASVLAGPGQGEGIIPIDDDRATSALAMALVKHMPGTSVHVNLHGPTLRQLVSKISHEVKTGNVVLVASHAGAVRKKS
jgi:hypothetical protein